MQAQSVWLSPRHKTSGQSPQPRTAQASDLADDNLTGNRLSAARGTLLAILLGSAIWGTALVLVFRH
jgi:hypothetical protein